MEIHMNCLSDAFLAGFVIWYGNGWNTLCAWKLKNGGKQMTLVITFIIQSSQTLQSELYPSLWQILLPQIKEANTGANSKFWQESLPLCQILQLINKFGRGRRRDEANQHSQDVCPKCSFMISHKERNLEKRIADSRRWSAFAGFYLLLTSRWQWWKVAISSKMSPPAGFCYLLV